MTGTSRAAQPRVPWPCPRQGMACGESNGSPSFGSSHVPHGCHPGRSSCTEGSLVQTRLPCHRQRQGEVSTDARAVILDLAPSPQKHLFKQIPAPVTHHPSSVWCPHGPSILSLH